MKKTILLIAILATTILGAFAQRGGQQANREMPNPEQRAERMTDRLQADLNLSDEQRAEVYKINLQHAQERHAEMEAMRAEREKRQAKMRERSEAQFQSVESVLTEEQKEKWSEIREDRKRKGHEMREERSRGGKEMRRGGRGNPERKGPRR